MLQARESACPQVITAGAIAVALLWSMLAVATAQTEPEETAGGCWQDAEHDYDPADRQLGHETAAAAVGAAQEHARGERDAARSRRPLPGSEPYEGYDIAVQEAHVLEFEGLAAHGRTQRPDGRGLSVWRAESGGELRAELIAEEVHGPGAGWLVVMERWRLPDLVCERLKARQRPVLGDTVAPESRLEPR